MSSANRRTKLPLQIAEILGSAEYGSRNTDQSALRSGLRNSIACGSMVLLTANPLLVSAAGLGEVALKSQLGQPLHATVPLTLGPGESLSENCIQPAPASGNLAPPPDMRVHSPALKGPGTFELRVTTANPLHEPMYELSLMIKCQGNAMLVRQYVLMLDLPGMPVTEVAAQLATVPARTVTTPSVTTQARITNRRAPVSSAPRITRDPARALPPTNNSIAAGSQYRVARGDSLSTIARRVEGRLADTTWSVAARIFMDNPRAFIGGDPDMIKLGSVLRMPETAVLASMTPGSRRSIQARTASDSSTLGSATAAAIASSRPEPREAPAPQPDVINRENAAVVRQSNEATTQSVSLEPVVAGDASNAAVAATETAPIQVATLAETSMVETLVTPAASSPFIDEIPTVVNETAVIPQQPPAELPASAAADAGDSSGSSSLLSILIGLLLGAAVSLIALRGRLLAALGLGRRSHSSQRFARATVKPQKSATDTSEFDQSQAAAAFDRSASDIGQKQPLTISAPPENTYIVEQGVAEATLENEASDLQGEPDRTEAPEAAQESPDFSSEAIDEDSAELAALFETVATMDDSDRTAEMPVPADDAIFDPSAEIPGDAMPDVFDPTGGVDESLMDAFDENLSNIDPDEMFATGKLTGNDVTGDADLDVLAETINSPANDQTMAMELDDLPTGDDMSETHQEALELLERDYEDEFTASQIIERATLEEALKQDREVMEGEENDTDFKQRKIS